MSKLTPSFPVQLGGELHRLKFDFNSAAALKEWSSVNVFGGDNPLGTVREEPADSGDDAEPKTTFTMDPIRLRALVAACLLHEDIQFQRTGVASLPPYKVGGLIAPDDIPGLTVAVMQAFAAYFGKTLEELTAPVENPTPEATERIPSASINSGRSLATTSA